MTKPKVIIYDNDGMLTEGGRFSEKYSQEFGVPLEEMTPFFAGPFKDCLLGKADLRDELVKVLLDWKWGGTVEELMNYWFSVGNVLHEGVYGSVQKLKDQGLVVCLATNQEKYRLQYLTQRFSYDSLFNEMFSSSELGVHKHSEEGLEKISAHLRDKYGVEDRGEIMFWDDRENNVKNFSEAGFNSQLYRGYPSFKEVLAQHGLDL